MFKSVLLALTILPLAGAALADDFTGEKPAVQTADRLEWAWDGGDRLEVAVPGTVHYQAGGAPRVIVRGPADLLKRVRYDHGDLGLERSLFDWNNNGEKLDVTVTGTPLTRVGVAGSADVELGDLHQDHLMLSIAGSGRVAASGRADDLSVHIAGSGRGKLAKLASKSFSAHIAGSGTVDSGSADSANISIAGSGEVHFAGAMPKDITNSVMGSGTITDGEGRVISPRLEARRARERDREERTR
jgi:hypothetical protein